MEPIPHVVAVQVVKVRYQPPGKRVHRHTLTQVLECECGCTQLELFSASAAHPGDFALLDTEFSSGARARAAIGHLSDKLNDRYPDQFGWSINKHDGSRMR